MGRVIFKISARKKNLGSSLDCFTITIPELEIIGKVNTKHITQYKIDKIKDFIKLNMNIIIDICDEKIDTVDFINQMKKV
jgi:nucleotidyltransferase/DNA polymerase involved in DNA repair